MSNIGVLASTKATDMQAIIDAIKNKKLNAKISVVISNKKGSYALERAREQRIKAIFIDPKGKEREEYDREVSKVIEAEKVQLILLIGYMRIFSKWFVDKYKNKVMNIHPSLLPAYSGGMDLNVHEEVLKRGCRITGASLIFIDEGADTGPIILQKALDVEQHDNPETLKEKVQKAEQEILVEGVRLFSENKIKVEGNLVRISR